MLLRGPAAVHATVFDNNDGSYEAMALLVEPGKYSVQATLEYTLCDGLKDPPENWFRVGKYISPKATSSLATNPKARHTLETSF